jgi:hypothetical protein
MYSYTIRRSSGGSGSPADKVGVAEPVEVSEEALDSVDESIASIWLSSGELQLLLFEVVDIEGSKVLSCWG